MVALPPRNPRSAHFFFCQKNACSVPSDVVKLPVTWFCPFTRFAKLLTPPNVSRSSIWWLRYRNAWNTESPGKQDEPTTCPASLIPTAELHVPPREDLDTFGGV